MDSVQDIFFGDFYFTHQEYELEDFTKAKAWFLGYNTHVQLDGNYGPFLDREEVLKIAPFIESKMVIARENAPIAEAGEDEPDMDKIFRDMVKGIGQILGQPPPGNGQIPGILPIIQMMQNMEPPPNLNAQ
jgi:hypothetical protein